MTSVPDGSECRVSRPGWLPLWKFLPVPTRVEAGWVPVLVWTQWRWEKPCPCRELSTGLPARSPSLYRLSYIYTHIYIHEHLYLLGCNAVQILSPATRWFLAWLIPLPWTWWQHIPPNCQLIFNEVRGVRSKKRDLFISTAVGTSNPIQIHVYIHQHKTPNGVLHWNGYGSCNTALSRYNDVL
jgi:hypothetical protein